MAHPTGFEPVTSAFGGQIRRLAEVYLKMQFLARRLYP